MKKVQRFTFTLTLTFVVFSFSNPCYAWQGRMGGMGDPNGLVADESDFLIHPSKISGGEGVKFYGDYRFTYTDVKSWDYRLNRLNTAGTLLDFFSYDTSGDEYKHNAMVGAGFPLGPGRMGLFFSYDGIRGDYGMNEDILMMDNYAEYDLNRDFDNFALRLLYGLPLRGSFKVGGELQFAYRQEENESLFKRILSYGILLNQNHILGLSSPHIYSLPILIPYDSSYWETLMKGSLDGQVGPVDLAFTLRGGLIFSGDNSLVMERENPAGTMEARVVHDGGVDGWRIGCDLWLRYALANDLALPFLVRVDYQLKNRDGEGRGEYWFLPWTNISYKNEEKNFRLTAGGGVDKQFGAGWKIAAGIYYNYLRGENDLKSHMEPATNYLSDSNKVPNSTEHQVMLRLVDEFGLSPAATLRMGLTPFFGWVREDFEYTFFDSATPQFTDNLSLDGYHWGIGASLGGTIRFKPITLEPFINGGWQKVDLDGDGDRRGTVATLWKMDKSREEWYIGGGLSIKFN